MRRILMLLLLIVLPFLVSMLPFAAGALPGADFLPGDEPVVPAYNLHNLHIKE